MAHFNTKLRQWTTCMFTDAPPNGVPKHIWIVTFEIPWYFRLDIRWFSSLFFVWTYINSLKILTVELLHVPLTQINMRIRQCLYKSVPEMGTGVWRFAGFCQKVLTKFHSSEMWQRILVWKMNDVITSHFSVSPKNWESARWRTLCRPKATSGLDSLTWNFVRYIQHVVGHLFRYKTIPAT